ncbi:Cyclopentanol dehydrogenase [Paraburkholderia kirstenboschensis]|uniref:SDR family NAD(P)-dependent oxidoreductase n=1 Tax=Paraburkholderia kirstenboschensis TaxID=1245436 RepID=UPI000B0F37D4|nr:SDR family oxidoreductase [Paraburkholderia kirstenboschensis]CAD6558683.1 Cyclopentanol dehydrogenase [Paraburkholderia kirstenboschensis]
MGNRIKDKVAIVTGGAGGIGSATGTVFCEEGGKVVLVDRDGAALDDAAARIRDTVPGATVLTVIADVANEISATDIAAKTLDGFGRIDVLVNNAGIRSYSPLAEASAQSWQDILGVNLLSYAFMSKAVIPAMRASRQGSIINISSTYAVTGRPGMGQYDATKAAILALTRTLAFEETPNGIRANAVCPGFTLTPFHVAKAQANGQSAEDLRTADIDGCLMRRWADPREVAYPILWLASDEASYITASTLMVDGGRPVV